MSYERLIIFDMTGKKCRIAIGTFNEKNTLSVITTVSIPDEAEFVGITLDEYKDIVSRYKCYEITWPSNIFIFTSEEECQKAINELEMIKKLINKV